MYDPTLALHFEKELFYEMNEQRGAAAAVLLLHAQYGDWEKVPRASDIEPVFDFFDNLGFYLYGSQISDRVLHQSFCHWILLYYQDGCSYIRQRQDEPEGEKSTWEYVEYLVKQVRDIEAAKQGCAADSLRLGPEKYKKYLLEEFDEAEDQFKEDCRKAQPGIFTLLPEKQQG